MTTLGGTLSTATTSSCAAVAPVSRLARRSAVVEVLVSAKLKLPLPVTRGVTFVVLHAPAVSGPDDAVIVPAAAGAFRHVIVDSPQPFWVTPRTSYPMLDAAFEYTRKVALVTTPERPLTLKRR